MLQLLKKVVNFSDCRGRDFHALAVGRRGEVLNRLVSLVFGVDSLARDGRSGKVRSREQI